MSHLGIPSDLMTVEQSADHLRPCGICGENCNHLGARGRVVVCPKCELRVTDADGRPVEVAEGFTFSGCIRVMTGPTVSYRTEKGARPEACDSVNKTHIAFVDGKPVELFEGVAGWLGWVLPRT